MSKEYPIPLDELGKRMAAARKARGLSQEIVAQRLGVSRPTYIAMEKGTRVARPEELTLFAELTRRSLNWLLGEHTVLTDFAPQFRQTEASKVSEEAVLEAVDAFRQLCEDYMSLEKITGARMPSTLQPDYTDFVKSVPVTFAAESVAQRERQRLALGQGPLRDFLTTLDGDYGLRVFVSPLNEFHVAGMFVYDRLLGGCILINGTHPHTRQRWTMAHELAHYLGDRERQEVTVSYAHTRKPREEQFADCFAAEFLMPAEGVKQRFWQVAHSKNDFTVADLCLLAHQYEVSVEVMAYRLEALRCLPNGVGSSLKQHTLRKTKEELGLKAPDAMRLQLPNRYRRLAVLAYMQDQIGESALAEYLRCNIIEARDVVKELSQSAEVSLSGEAYTLEFRLGDVLAADGNRDRTEEG